MNFFGVSLVPSHNNEEVGDELLIQELRQESANLTEINRQLQLEVERLRQQIQEVIERTERDERMRQQQDDAQPSTERVRAKRRKRERRCVKLHCIL